MTYLVTQTNPPDSYQLSTIQLPFGLTSLLSNLPSKAFEKNKLPKEMNLLILENLSFLMHSASTILSLTYARNCAFSNLVVLKFVPGKSNPNLTTIIDKLPATIVELSMSAVGFTNESLSKLRYNSLERLHLFDGELTDFSELPKSIIHLSLICFDNLVDEYLRTIPSSLKSLEISYCNELSEGCVANIPQTVNEISIRFSWPHLSPSFPNLLKSSVTKLTIEDDGISDSVLSRLPKFLTSLRVTECDGLTLSQFPESITLLRIDYPQSLGDFSLAKTNVQELIIDTYDKGIWPLTIESNYLKKITLIDVDLAGVTLSFFPNGLNHLVLIDCFNVPENDLKANFPELIIEQQIDSIT
jgi:hypothetical protein